jgi:hypothetical protein
MTLEGTVEEDAARRRGRQLSGRYWPLCEFLDHRHADTVALTFAQIEDLVAFTLPDRARTDPEWWTVADAGPAVPGHSHAWTLTRRTARPNLLAKIVVFERAVR